MRKLGLEPGQGPGPGLWPPKGAELSRQLLPGDCHFPGTMSVCVCVCVWVYLLFSGRQVSGDEAPRAALALGYLLKRAGKILSRVRVGEAGGTEEGSLASLRGG